MSSVKGPEPTGLTIEQQDAVEKAVDLQPGQALKVIAFAGAGKTFTLKKIAKAKKGRGLYLAFNASIAKEARTKFADTRCHASTIHATALAVVRGITGEPRNFKAVDVIESGVIAQVKMPRMAEWSETRIAYGALKTIAHFCNSDDKMMSDKHAELAIIDLVGDPDFLTGKSQIDRARTGLDYYVEPIRQVAFQFWAHCIKEKKCNHDMYLKVIDLENKLRQQAFAGFDYIMMDEAQDTNAVQRSILMKTGLPVIAVGDSYQSIYSWRGADDALKKLPGEEAYLTQSFRFGENIASLARDILASRPDGGPEKQLTGLGPGNSYPENKSRRAIICRTNMGIINEAMKLAKSGTPFNVSNIETVFDDLNSALAIKQRKPSLVTKPEFKHFASWEAFKYEAEAGGDQTMQQIVRIISDDRVDDVRKLANMNRTNQTPDTVELTTIHKSKGNEWSHVTMGEDCRSYKDLTERYREAQTKSAKHVTMAMEEFNAFYVGVTRAMHSIDGHEHLMPPPQPKPVHFAAQ